MNKINFFDTYIDSTAKESVAAVLGTTFISEGAKVKEFEQAIEAHFGIKNVVAVNSGTASLHLAMILAGVEQGDEVIIPAQTFIATGLAVLMQKATPIFCDIEYNTGNIDVTQIEAKITNKTKAICAVHWAGLPCDMDAINTLAKKHNIQVIEDAAHALGAKYKNQFVGGLSDFTCLSFQAIKGLTTGDGGAIIVEDDALYEKAKRIRWFGLDRKNSIPSILGERDFDVTELGYKYHLNDYAATLGLANLTNFDQRLARVREIAKTYTQALMDIPDIQLFENSHTSNASSSSNWLFGLHVERRLDFIKLMKSHEIPVSVVHQGIDKNSIFGGLDNSLEIQRKFDATQIHLPIHSAMDYEQIAHVVNTIKRGW